MKKILITGSCGLIGSQAVRFFSKEGWEVHGIDNNKRKLFFGEEGDTTWNKDSLQHDIPDYKHYIVDITEKERIERVIVTVKPDAIIHAAAQPSHDKAASIVYEDFFTNAVGTLYLLETTRKLCPAIPFVFLSTNKVYGDNPNKLDIVETETRFAFNSYNEKGINEHLSVDQTTHSLFGASKLSADVLVQEYGRYFGMRTCCLRCGCLTGEDHSSVKLHGFLNYLVKSALTTGSYEIIGYKGKQVRDNLHAYDVITFINEFIKNPRKGEVYNLGGGKENSCSILEAINLVHLLSGREIQTTYVEKNRIGDHIVYYSDLTKCKTHYPNWTIKYSLHDIIYNIIAKHKKQR